MAMSEADARFEALVRQAPVGLAIVDRDGRLLLVNPTACDMIGQPADTLVGQSVLPLFDAHDQDQIAAVLAECLAHPRATLVAHARTARAGGHWLDLEVTVVNELQDPALQGVILSLRDLTRYRAAADSVRASEAHFRALFDNALDAMLLCDSERRFIDANAAACKLLQRSKADLLTIRLDDLRPPDASPMLERLWQDFLHHGTLDGELEPLRPDGSTRLVRYRATANVSAERHLFVFHDLTEHRRLEGQFLQAQKMEPLGRLAGGIAHDFNNLLTAIGGYTEFLAEAFAESDPRLREVDEIRKATERATALTRQLLAFSRKQAMKLTALDLNAVVGNMDRMLRRLIGEDVTLKTALAPDLEPAQADAGQIEQVIVNLAVNARDAMPRGGHLRLETGNVALRDVDVSRLTDVEPGSYVMLAITDTGVGMSHETKAHLFEPFFTTKERGRGTGLGLSTVYGIVKQCGGHIAVVSDVDRGTTFRVYLPRATGQTAPLPGAQPEISGGSETILVVEDDASVLRLTREALERRGYRVMTAAGWLEALDLVSRTSIVIDLVLTDVVMPGMGGRVLGDRIRLIRPDVKLLYMSGYPEGALDHQGSRRPGIDLLEKPFTADGLALKVRQALDQPA
jgi:PAS domain S-box-containing protein